MLSLPAEVLQEVAIHLPIAAIGRLGLTCATLQNSVCHDPVYWQRWYHRHYSSLSCADYLARVKDIYYSLRHNERNMVILSRGLDRMLDDNFMVSTRDLRVAMISIHEARYANALVYQHAVSRNPAPMLEYVNRGQYLFGVYNPVAVEVLSTYSITKRGIKHFNLLKALREDNIQDFIKYNKIDMDDQEDEDGGWIDTLFMIIKCDAVRIFQHVIARHAVWFDGRDILICYYRARRIHEIQPLDIQHVSHLHDIIVNYTEDEPLINTLSDDRHYFAGFAHVIGAAMSPAVCDQLLTYGTGTNTSIWCQFLAALYPYIAHKLSYAAVIEFLRQQRRDAVAVELLLLLLPMEHLHDVKVQRLLAAYTYSAHGSGLTTEYVKILQECLVSGARPQLGFVHLRDYGMLDVIGDRFTYSRAYQVRTLTRYADVRDRVPTDSYITTLEQVKPPCTLMFIGKL